MAKSMANFFIHFVTWDNKLGQVFVAWINFGHFHCVEILIYGLTLCNWNEFSRPAKVSGFIMDRRLREMVAASLALWLTPSPRCVTFVWTALGCQNVRTFMSYQGRYGFSLHLDRDYDTKYPRDIVPRGPFSPPLSRSLARILVLELPFAPLLQKPTTMTDIKLPIYVLSKRSMEFPFIIAKVTSSSHRHQDVLCICTWKRWKRFLVHSI